MRILLCVLVLIVGCHRSRDTTHVDGVIDMGDVPAGWGSQSVPVGHPPILICPEDYCETQFLVRNSDVAAFSKFHNGMKFGPPEYEEAWKLVPFNEKYHKLVPDQKEK